MSTSYIPVKDGWVENRNGFRLIKEIEVAITDEVTMTGVGKSNTILRGLIGFDRSAAIELASKNSSGTRAGSVGFRHRKGQQ